MRAPIEQPAACYHLTDHPCTSPCIQAPCISHKRPCASLTRHAREACVTRRDKAKRPSVACKSMPFQPSTHSPTALSSSYECPDSRDHSTRESLPIRACSLHNSLAAHSFCCRHSTQASERCENDTNTHLCRLPHKQKKQPSVATTERTDFQPSTYAVASLFPNSQPGRKTLYSPSEGSQVCCDEKLSRSPVAKLTRAAESGRRTHHQPAAAQQPVHIARHLLLLCVSFCGPPVNRVHVQQPLALVASRPNERTADRKSTNRKSQKPRSRSACCSPSLLASCSCCSVRACAQAVVDQQ